MSSRRCLICSNFNPCVAHSEAMQDAELERNDAAIARIRSKNTPTPLDDLEGLIESLDGILDGFHEDTKAVRQNKRLSIVCSTEDYNRVETIADLAIAALRQQQALLDEAREVVDPFALAHSATPDGPLGDRAYAMRSYVGINHFRRAAAFAEKLKGFSSVKTEDPT